MTDRALRVSFYALIRVPIIENMNRLEVIGSVEQHHIEAASAVLHFAQK